MRAFSIEPFIFINKYEVFGEHTRSKCPKGIYGKECNRAVSGQLSFLICIIKNGGQQNEVK